MSWLTKQIQKQEWSPYAAGVLLGLVGILTVVFSHKLLGASGGFENLAGAVGKAAAPGLFSNTYFNFVMPAGMTYALSAAGRDILRRHAGRVFQPNLQGPHDG